MKYTYSDGCTIFSTNVDGKELINMPLEEAKNHVINIINHMDDMANIQEMFQRALSIAGECTIYDRCEDCGDVPYKYTLEL